MPKYVFSPLTAKLDLVSTAGDFNHNDLANIQGGTTNEYYHLTSAQHTVVGNTSGINTGDETKASIKTKLGQASDVTDGYLSYTDWNTFYNGYIKTVMSDPLTGTTGQQIINLSTDELKVWYLTSWNVIHTFISSLQQEDGYFLSLENGDKILLESN